MSSGGSDGAGGRQNDGEMSDSNSRQASSHQARQALLQLLQSGTSAGRGLDVIQRSLNSQPTALEQALAFLPLLQQQQQQQQQHQPQHSLNNISSFLNNATDVTNFSNQQHQQLLSSARMPPAQQRPTPVDSSSGSPHLLEGLSRLLQMYQTQSAAGTARNSCSSTLRNPLASADLISIQRGNKSAAASTLENLQNAHHAGMTASMGQPQAAGAAATSFMPTAAQRQQVKEKASVSLPPSEEGTIVTCRARGISKDHNKKTAYFVIPDNVKHGADLLCSHIQCQNKGIRFVFCIVCDEPVAKINFKTRHSHLDVLNKPPWNNDNSGSNALANKNSKSEVAAATTSSTNEISSASEDMEGKFAALPHRKRKMITEGKSIETSLREGDSNSEEVKQNVTVYSSSNPCAGRGPDSGDANADQKLQKTGSGSDKTPRLLGKRGNGENRPSSHESSPTSTGDEEGNSDDNSNRRRHKKLLSSLPKSINAIRHADNTQESTNGTSSSSRKRRKTNQPTSLTTNTSGGGNSSSTHSCASSYESLQDSAMNDETRQQQQEERGEGVTDIENEWIRLLNERPNTKKRKRMKAWLARILSFSECMAAEFSASSSSEGATSSSPDRSDDGIVVN